jgi:hypothetical protein
MPKGQSSNGNWNFRIKRSKCPKCNKKGLYKGAKGWISCMYCKTLETNYWTDNYQKLLQIIETKNPKTPLK